MAERAAVIRLALTPVATAAAEVRAELRAVIAGSALEARGDDAALATSELVTNALLHGREPVTVTLHLSEERLRVEVRDTSPVSPTFSLLDPTAVTGRGLLLVASLADRWGVEPEADGKTVWVELSEVAPAPDAEADVEALLASWADELAVDPADEQVRVVVTDLDTSHMARSEAHAEAVLRELTMLGANADPRVQQAASRILTAAERFDAARAELKRQLAVAVARRHGTVDVELSVTRSDAETVRDYSHALVLADDLCRSGLLLQEAADGAVTDCRRDFLRRVLAQLGS